MLVTYLGEISKPFGYNNDISVYVRDSVIYYGNNIVNFLGLSEWYSESTQRHFTDIYYIKDHAVGALAIPFIGVQDMLYAAESDGFPAIRVDNLPELDNLARAMTRPATELAIVETALSTVMSSEMSPRTRADEIISKINAMDTFKTAEYEIASLAGVTGLYVLGLSHNAAMYAISDNIGAVLLSKFREYRAIGIEPSIIAVWQSDAMSDSQQLLKRIDMFVEQHCAGFTCAEGRFINLAHWDKKRAIIDGLC